MENTALNTNSKTFKNLLDFIKILCLFVFCLVIYQTGFDNGFVNWDDPGLFNNEKIQHFSKETVLTIFTSVNERMYQPFTYFCFLLINQIELLNPSYFHIFSFLLHFVNSLLVMVFCQQLLSSKTRAFLIALLFASHPLQVEAVSWISATSTVIFSFFFLTASISYVRYLKQKNQAIVWYFISIICFTLGVFSKVQIVALVAVLPLLDWFFLGPGTFQKKRILDKLPYALISFASVYIHLQFQQGGTPPSNFIDENSSNYLIELLIPYQLMWYPIKILFPFQLATLYDFPNQLHWIHYLAFIPVFVSLWFIANPKTNKVLIFGLLFYVANIVLSTHIVSIFVAPYADRYAYISMLGIFIFVFSLVPQKYNRKFYVIVFLMISINTALSIKQVKTWENSFELWTHNLRYNNNANSYIGLGNYYKEKGDFEAAEKAYTKAIASEHVSTDNFKYLGHCLLGEMHQQNHMFSRAEKNYLKALAINDSNLYLYLALEALYQKTQRYEEALKMHEKAVSLGAKATN